MLHEALPKKLNHTVISESEKLLTWKENLLAWTTRWYFFQALHYVHLLFLQSVLRKVNSQDAQQIARPIMDALLQMLSLGGASVSGVQEDALMAIGTLVEGLYINRHCCCSVHKFSRQASTRTDFLHVGLEKFLNVRYLMRIIAI